MTKEIREQLFVQLFETYVQKGVYPQSPKFTTEDLGIFASDSENICKFLIEQIDLNNSHVRIDLSLYLLVRNSHWQERKEEVAKKIKQLLKSPDSPVSIKTTSISALGWFKIINRSLIDELMETLDLSDKEIQERFYYYIANSDFLEDYFPFILDCYLKKESHFDFKYGILFYLKRPESFQYILSELNKQEFRHNQDGNIADTLIEMKKKLIFSEDIPNIVYDSFKAHLQYFPNGILKSSFIEYIDKFNLRELFFKQLLADYFGDGQDSAFYCLHLLLDKNNVSSLITELSKKALALDQLFGIRNVLSSADDKEAFELFYSKINKLYGNQLQWQEPKNIHLETTKQEVTFLHNKDYFLSVGGIFFGDSKKAIDKDYLYSSEWFKKHDDHSMLAALNILRRIFGTKAMTKSQLVKFVNNRREWDFVRAVELTQIMQRRNYPIDAKTASFLEKWARRRIASKRFEKTFFRNKDREWRYYYPELLASGICQFFDLELTNADYINLIRLDCHLIPYIENQNRSDQIRLDNVLRDSRLITYIVSKIGEDQTELEIVRNLREADLYEDIINHHLRFLRLRERTEHRELFLNKNLKIYRPTALVWFVELLGDLDMAVKELKHIENHERWSVVDAIIKRDKNILHTYLIESYEKTESEEDKARAITYLLKCDQEVGLTKMKDWITTCRHFTYNSWAELAVNSSSKRKLEVLKEICYDSLENNYGGDGPFGERRNYLNALAELGKSNWKTYKEVSEFLTAIVTNNPDLSFLHGTIADMEFDFFKNQTYSMSLDEVLVLINESQSSPQDVPKGMSKPK
ncbi:MAG: hypothetical protein RIF36_17605 [Imperialibacter sp.]|uniref:hypothetical protein n=1 Tax=Imperialibacter sp. TaxID=2038411 RepID=UPI0032EF4D84